MQRAGGVVSLDERRVVRTSIPLARGDDLWSHGSGYLIADDLVLTAAHVLERTTAIAPQTGDAAEVACLGGDWLSATVVWVDAGRDVAILRCHGLAASGSTETTAVGGRIVWGRLDLDAAGE